MVGLIRRESPLEQVECISQMRERIIKEMESTGNRSGWTCEKNDNVDQNIRVIRAILASNGEILSRVIGSMKRDSDRGSVFRRFGFEVVTVQQTASKVQFITYPESSEMTFDLTPLKTVPASLMLQPIYKTDFVSHVDFELFFQRALGALHRDVLPPFLVNLKDHLESIQVCLGKVDSWLLDAECNMKFLETTFGVSLEMPGEAEVYVSNTGGPYVPGTDRCLTNETCVHCNSLFSWHQCIFHNGYYYRRCTGPSSTKPGDGPQTFFSYPRHQLLKECKVDGRFEVAAVFSVSQAGELERLSKLLDFMSYWSSWD